MISLSKLINSTKSILNLRIIAASFQTSAANQVQPTLEEKLGLPPRPKRPLTPYFRFLKDNRPQIAKEHPSLSSIELMKMCAEKYKAIDNKTKVKYSEEYAKEQLDYAKRKFQYESKLTLDQKQTIQDAKEAVHEKRERINHKKKLRENNKPKRPTTGFIRYLMEQASKEPRGPSQNFREWQNGITSKWKALSDAQKKPYNDAAHIDFTKYKEELAKWELQMIRLGNTDLVRESAMIEKTLDKPKRRNNKKAAPSSDSD